MPARRAVTLAAVLVLASLSVPVGGATAQSDGDRTLERTATLSLTPESPGEVDVTVRYEVPDAVESVTTGVPADATLLSTDGFDRQGTATYAWDGETPAPTFTMSVPVNETSATGYGPAEGRFEFVDVGEWALVRVPHLQAQWSWRGTENVSLNATVRTDGGGFVGEAMAYLGPYATHSRQASGQTFSVVVPDAATPAAEPSAVLDSLAAASRALRVGDRDARVNVFLAPDTVGWAAQGIQYGDTDAWVHEDARLRTASNTYLHEYVHTRQDFDPETGARWLVEASAEYYASLLSLEQGLVDFAAFREHLARGSEDVYRETVLARPSTWVAGAQYYRGNLVVGAVDRRIRTASGGEATFADVFERLNEGDAPVSDDAYAASVAAVAGDDVADAAARYATSTDAPPVWDREAHLRSFGIGSAAFDVGLAADDFRVTGPYGPRTVGESPTLYPGESIRVNASVTNAGTVGGSDVVALVVDGEVAAETVVELGANGSTTVTLAATFDDTGAHELRVGFDRVPVTVERPAPVSVTDLSVGDGESLAITAVVTGDAETPSRGTVAVTVDGATVETRAVTLGPGETVRIETTVQVDPGSHTVRVGNESASVEVTTTGADPATPGVPGFGVGVALVALVGVALVAAARSP